MPTVHLKIDDVAEVTSCCHCHAHLQPYNNTSLSAAPIHSPYTQTLLSHHHINCHKCGLYVEFHPQHAREESLIFLCSNAAPCPHGLCYDCGVLYQLRPDASQKCGLLTIGNCAASSARSAQLSSKHHSTNAATTNGSSSNTNNGRNTNLDMVSHATFVAEMIHEITAYQPSHSKPAASSGTTSDASTTSAPANTTTDDSPTGTSTSTSMGGPNSDSASSSAALLMGTLMAVCVWCGMNAPQLFAMLLWCLWFIVFYAIVSLYYMEQETIQSAVLSLFGFAPLLLSLYVLYCGQQHNKHSHHNVKSNTNTRSIYSRSNRRVGCRSSAARDDALRAVQFLCVFGSAAYYVMGWTPMDMYLFVVDDFVSKLSGLEQLISLFIAISVMTFCAVLARNYGCCVLCENDSEQKDSHHDVLHHEPVSTKQDLHKESSSSLTHHDIPIVVNAGMEESKKKRKRRRRKRRKHGEEHGLSKDMHHAICT